MAQNDLFYVLSAMATFAVCTTNGNSFILLLRGLFQHDKLPTWFLFYIKFAVFLVLSEETWVTYLCYINAVKQLRHYTHKCSRQTGEALNKTHTTWVGTELCLCRITGFARHTYIWWTCGCKLIYTQAS